MLLSIICIHITRLVQLPYLKCTAGLTVHYSHSYTDITIFKNVKALLMTWTKHIESHHLVIHRLQVETTK